MDNGAEGLKAEYLAAEYLKEKGYVIVEKNASFPRRGEIDIVALYLEKKHAFVAEVKRQKKNFKPEIFQQKVDYLRHSLLHGYTIDTACLSLEDM